MNKISINVIYSGGKHMTAQIGEFIIFDGEQTMMHSCPPIPTYHNRIIQKQGREGRWTG
jgi:hypothetical protein